MPGLVWHEEPEYAKDETCVQERAGLLGEAKHYCRGHGKHPVVAQNGPDHWTEKRQDGEVG